MLLTKTEKESEIRFEEIVTSKEPPKTSDEIGPPMFVREWTVSAGPGEPVHYLACTLEAATWLHERMQTLEYLQGGYRKGGQATSEAKTTAARANGKKGGRPTNGKAKLK